MLYSPAVIAQKIDYIHQNPVKAGVVYNFNTPLLDMDGNSSPELLNKILANLLMQAANTQNPLKFFEWALKLNSDGEIHLDSTDKELMVNFIKSHEQLTVLGKGRLLEVLK